MRNCSWVMFSLRQRGPLVNFYAYPDGKILPDGPSLSLDRDVKGTYTFWNFFRK